MSKDIHLQPVMHNHSLTVKPILLPLIPVLSIHGLTSSLAHLPISPLFHQKLIFIMLHITAQEVYDHQQQQIYKEKSTPPSLPCQVTSEDDVV